MNGDRSAVGKSEKFAPFVYSRHANASLAVPQNTFPRAKLTSYNFIPYLFPVHGRIKRRFLFSRSKKKKTEAAKPAAPPKTETTIEFTGLAPTDLQVAKLIANLNKSPLFSQVNLKLSEEHKFANEVIRRFQLQLVLDQDARASNKDVEMARHKHISGM